METEYYIVNLSGGLTSFEALDRTIGKYGKDKTIPIFANTLIEDSDLYRFLIDQEQYYGIKIVKLADGRTPFEVWIDEGVITASNGYAPCSEMLKRNVIDKWINDHFYQHEHTRVFGMDWSEVDRAIRLRDRLAPVNTWFPLMERPFLDKCQIADKLERIGIKVPSLYNDGFVHNNCGGGCVKAGKAHWARLWKKRPEIYLMWEQKEWEFIQHIGKIVSILKERKPDGNVSSLTLTEFRYRLMFGIANYDKNDFGGCGCFSNITQDRMDDLLLNTDVKLIGKSGMRFDSNI